MQEAKESKDTEEIWKDIKGYEGIYQVSSEGRVKSLERDIICKNGVKRHIKERIRECLPSMSESYTVVDLWKGGQSRCMDVDYLVANAFIPNPENYVFIKHKNKITTDNQVDNLEWTPCDRSVEYVNGFGEIKTFSSTADAAQYMGRSILTIVYLARHVLGTWKYVED